MFFEVIFQPQQLSIALKKFLLMITIIIDFAELFNKQRNSYSVASYMTHFCVLLVIVHLRIWSHMFNI